ncbi:MAG: histidinol-phosphatase [Pseudomonadota bacterium]
MMQQSHDPGSTSDSEPARADPPEPNAHTAIQPIAAAHAYCDLARKAILPHFRTAMAVENKFSDAGISSTTGAFSYDPVTKADRDAERAIRAAIERDFPDDGFIGEETGQIRLQANHRWIVDPIDGTRAFITGSPLWGTLIGRLSGTRPELGFMDQPFTQERFWSDGRQTYFARGSGQAVREGQRVSTRQGLRLADATVSTTHPDLFSDADDAARFKDVSDIARAVRYGGDCYGYALLAMGGLDVVIEAGLQVYDIAALIPIIECAGGVITDWSGNPVGDGGRVVASGSKALHAEVLAELQR